MKLTCPNCGREHPLREPFPVPGSRIVCPCGRRLSVQYSPATLEQLKKRGARFQTEAESALGANRAIPGGVDEEATSLFTAQQIEEASRAARTAGGTLVPEAAPPVRSAVRALPPAKPEARKVPAVPPPPGPTRAPLPTTFEEEPTSLFMADSDGQVPDLRSIPDHGRTGLIVPASAPSAVSTSIPPVHPPPAVPAPPLPPAPPAGARPVVIESPTPSKKIFGGGPDLMPAAFEPQAAPAPSSMEPVASATALPADQAFPESASGVRRGATLDEIMRLKVQDRSSQQSVMDKVPKAALALLVLLGLGAALFIVVAIAVVATR